MVALSTERRVFLWHVHPTVKPNEAVDKVSVSLDDIVGLLEAEWTAGRARVFLAPDTSRIISEDDPLANPKNQLYIADIYRDPANSTVTMLFNRGDPNTVSPGFINIPAGSVRTEHPRPPETPGWSAHLVISTDLVSGRHRACFEQMPKVSSGLVEVALERMLEAAVATNPEFCYEVVVRKGGKSKIDRRRYRPVLSPKRVPSENLLDDLENGVLSSVTLTRRKQYYRGVSESRVIKYQEEKIVLHTRPVDKSEVLTAIGDVLQQAKDDGFTSVTFKIENLPGNQTSSPTLDLASADALEQLYVRAHRIDDFDDVLLQVYPTICSAISTKMNGIVNNQGLW